MSGQNIAGVIKSLLNDKSLQLERARVLNKGILGTDKENGAREE